MIRIDVMDNRFSQAYWNARRTLPVEHLESPRQYGRRWRETFRCRVDPDSPAETVYYIFDRDEDYTWFILQWQ